jgi:predicted MFS family arabinose efflux permease
LPELSLSIPRKPSSEGTHVGDTEMAVVAFLVFFSNSVFTPLVPCVAREFAVPPTSLKWLAPAFSAVYGLATLAYGTLSDRHGRRPVLKRLLCFATVAMAGLSLARSANQLVGLRALSGVATGGIVTIALSIVGDRYPYNVQGRPMGKMFGAIAAGMGFGVSLGPMVSTLIGWRNLLRLIAVGFLVAALWLRSGQREMADQKHPGTRLLLSLDEYRCILQASRGLRALILILANGFFHGGIFAWLGLFLEQRFRLSDAGIGAVLLGYGIPDLILGRVIGGWADRFGRRYVVPVGFFWAAACCALLALPFSPWTVALIIAALSIGFDATHPLMSSITTSLDPVHRGQVTGMTGFANFFGMAIGALAFHRLMLLGFSHAFVVFAGIQAASGLLAVMLFQSEVPMVQRSML